MKIRPKAPRFQSPDFSNATKDVEIISSLGTCEGCVHLEITKGAEFSAIQCLQPERVKQGLGTSTKHACRYRQIWVSKNRALRPKGNPFVLPTFPIEEVKPWPKFIWICDWCGEDVGGPHTPTCPHCAGPRPMHWRKQVVTK